MQNKTTTLGDLVKDYARRGVRTVENTVGGFISRNGKGVGLAFAATALYALYRGFITRWVNTPLVADRQSPNVARLLATVQRVITGNPPENSRNTPQLLLISNPGNHSFPCAAVGIASFRISEFIDPEDFTGLSRPNFSRPGEDVNYQFKIGVAGMITTAAKVYISNLHYNLTAVVGGGLVQAGLRKLGSVEIKKD